VAEQAISIGQAGIRLTCVLALSVMLAGTARGGLVDGESSPASHLPASSATALAPWQQTPSAPTDQAGLAGRAVAAGSPSRFPESRPGLAAPQERSATTQVDLSGESSLTLAHHFDVGAFDNMPVKPAWRPRFNLPEHDATGVVAVPVPPALFTALGVLLACAAIGLYRRFLA
jgi:hypothetical protein